MFGDRLKKRMLQAREDERRRLAGELHDRVLQVLSHVALSLELSRKCLLRSPEKAEADLTESEKEIRSSIREIRRIIYDSTVTWTPGSLTSKLLEEIRMIESRSGLKVNFQPGSVQEALPGHIEEQAFFAIREALINIDRHAKATGATLEMRVKQNAFAVSVCDNGAGFADVEKQSGERGYGLKNIARRIKELGGCFSLESQPGGGTRILFDVPLYGVVDPRAPWTRRLPRWLGFTGVRPNSLAWVAGAAVVVLLTVFATVGLRDKGSVATFSPTEPGLFDRAVKHYQQVSRGAGDMGRARTSPFELLDLSPWGYRILSRKSRLVNGRESRVYMYRGEKRDDLLVAEEFDAVSLRPPEGARRFRARGREFVSYSKEDVNTVAWEEDGVVCVLVSRIPELELVALAQGIGSRSQSSQ